jgi:hypothetical protein
LGGGVFVFLEAGHASGQALLEGKIPKSEIKIAGLH